MAFPLEPMPTLRQFINQEAIPGGCREGYSPTLLTHGEVQFHPHYLEGSNGVIYPLPPGMTDQDRMTPTLMASIARQLKLPMVGPYSHLYSHLIEDDA